eukprot:GCRY01002058.1.p1 GENE.GCRY01002058.1~~GCRY01002058.1.p1  ORF type:complete len:302 (-),score=17.30 GCRY01002058.1:54-899(-)
MGSFSFVLSLFLLLPAICCAQIVQNSNKKIFVDEVSPASLNDSFASFRSELGVVEDNVASLNQTLLNLQAMVSNLSNHFEATLKPCASSCLSLKNDFSENFPSGLYYLCPNGTAGRKVYTYCDMTTLGGGWTVIGQTTKAFPPSTFLVENFGLFFNQSDADYVSSSADNSAFSLKASDFSFGEVALGLPGYRVIQGYKATSAFQLERAFESVASGAETCVQTDAFLFDTLTGNVYSFRVYSIGESLLTTRRDGAAGGIDLAATRNCIECVCARLLLLFLLL